MTRDTHPPPFHAALSSSAVPEAETAAPRRDRVRARGGRERLIYEAPSGADRRFQAEILPAVSRSFALTIPQLPGRLRAQVTNAYLLCRIIDTIEDDPGLAPGEADRLLSGFLDTVRTGRGAAAFAADAVPRLSDDTPAAERRLVRECARVVRLNRDLPDAARASILRCLTTMAGGMGRFVRASGAAGLDSRAALERYCYVVAGVVGEMLTELFCEHSPAIAASRRELDERARSFGQGLQLTNILKDLWDDLPRGVCWLPRDVFRRHGFDLVDLGAPDARARTGFETGMREMVGIAHGNLRDALRYTIAIPREEVGIRRFLLWSVLLAVRTLVNIHRRPGFAAAGEIKVSRPTVAAIAAVPACVIRSDRAVAALFAAAARTLPRGEGGNRT